MGRELSPRNYSFVLHNMSGDDHLGIMRLGGDHEALAFARGIIRDIVCGDFSSYRGWSIQILSDRRDVARIPFGASI
jgi:hypothetical protein